MRLLPSIRFFLGILRRRLTGSGFPLTIIFNVTNRCNCRCRHCYASYFERDRNGEMSLEQVGLLLTDLSRNGCRRVSFSGGEPLLRKDIDGIIDQARSLGLSVTLNSNGILVTKHLEALEKLDALAISLDGRPEHHDILRGKGTGAGALEGVRQAAAAGIRVHVNMVVNKYNIDDIDYMIDLARQHGFRAEFGLAISNLYGAGAPPGDVKPTDDQFRRAIRRIIEEKRAGGPVLFSAAAYQSVLDCWGDYSVEGVMDGPPPEGMPQCPAGRLFCLIDADGTLWACPHLIGKIEAKNALKLGVAEAWRTAEKHLCTGCYQVYHHEFALLMKLSPRVVWNYAKAAVGLN